MAYFCPLMSKYLNHNSFIDTNEYIYKQPCNMIIYNTISLKSLCVAHWIVAVKISDLLCKPLFPFFFVKDTLLSTVVKETRQNPDSKHILYHTAPVPAYKPIF